MSISQLPDCKNVSLGTGYENAIRKMLFDADPGAADVFSIGMLHLTDYIGSRAALGTKAQKYKQSLMYNLGVPGFLAVIKVGQEQHPHALQPVIMAPDKPLIFGLKEYRLEEDWKPAFQKIWINQKSRRGG